jgi:hypothetical protein
MTGNKFRARADECFKAANSMADPERKLMHLDLAERWLRLAAQIEETDAATRCDASPSPYSSRIPPTRRANDKVTGHFPWTHEIKHGFRIQKLN